MKWIIKFKDGDNIYNHRYDKIDKKGEWLGNGDIMTFPTKEKAEEFLNTLDSREFKRWVAKLKPIDVLEENEFKTDSKTIKNLLFEVTKEERSLKNEVNIRITEEQKQFIKEHNISISKLWDFVLNKLINNQCPYDIWSVKK